MTKKMLWLVVSGLMALSLVMASCGPAATPATPTPATPSTLVTPATPATPTAPVEKEAVSQKAGTVKVTLTKLDGTTIDRMIEKPKYGGTITLAITADPPRWDAVVFATSSNAGHDYSGNEMMTGDWSRGPAGTGERTWWVSGSYETKTWRGELAERYEIPNDSTIIFHLRHGVRYALNPDSEASRLVGGREFTADDAAAEYERQWLKSPNSFVMGTTAAGERILSAKALDKYTVEIKVPPAFLGPLLIMTAEQTYIGGYAPEVIKKYGDANNWRNNVGTGPFILKDYTPGSVITRVKNPNYFESDPIFPENRLPYVDVIKELIIPDASTRQAALRTGKIEQMGGISWEDAELLAKTNSSLKAIQKTPNASLAIGGRMDKAELPFKDIRVRKALSMAINRQELVDQYYKGHAELFAYPYSKGVNPQLFTPLEQLSAEAKEIFSYNPEKARQLLKEAGYPTGFKTSIITTAANVDFLAIIREYLLKIGVDMALDVRDTNIVSTMTRGRTFPEMVYGNTQENWAVWKMHGIRLESATNWSYYPGDARSRAVYEDLNKYLGRDDKKVEQLLKDFAPYFIENIVWGAVLPLPYTYDVYQSWLKNFSGEEHVGYFDPDEAWRFRWIDQDLKKSMGY